MAVRKLTTGKWLCECYPAGRSGRRVRKQFATKGEALAFERHTMEETEAKPWLGESVDRRTLKDVVELWFKLHGKSLTAGQHVYDKLLLMVDALGNPIATDLTSKMFAHYRDKRLTGEIYFSEKWKKGASPVTINPSKAILVVFLANYPAWANGRIRTHWRTCENSPSQKKRWHGLPMSRLLNYWLIANVRTQFWHW